MLIVVVVKIMMAEIVVFLHYYLIIINKRVVANQDANDGKLVKNVIVNLESNLREVLLV